MKITYRASNGVLFDNEKDCLDYERKTNVPSLLCFDSTFEEFPLSWGTVFSRFESAFYFIALDAEAVSFVSSFWTEEEELKQKTLYYKVHGKWIAAPNFVNTLLEGLKKA